MINQILDYLGRENLEEIALRLHKPQRAIYIIVNQDGAYKAIDEKRMEFNSKYCGMDFYSQIVSTNKPVASKAIFSNNYYTFFIKRAVPQKDIDNYYSKLGLPESLEYIKTWVQEHLENLCEKYKNEKMIKIFFSATREEYRKAGSKNWTVKSISKTKQTGELGAPIYFNLNAKKMYAMDTRNIYRVDNNTGLDIKFFYDILNGMCSRGKNILYIWKGGFFAAGIREELLCDIPPCIFILFTRDNLGKVYIKDIDTLPGFSANLGAQKRYIGTLNMNEIIDYKIGEKIEYFRKQAKMSRAKLCEMTGIPAVTIESWEKGIRNPKMEGLEKVASALNIPVEMLIQNTK